MKSSTTGFPQNGDRLNHGHAPGAGFSLLDNVQLPSRSSSPQGSLYGSNATTSHTPQGRRQNLIQVIECAIAILDEDDYTNDVMLQQQGRFGSNHHWHSSNSTPPPPSSN